MKITIEHPALGQEDEIIIRCAVLEDHIVKLIKSLRAETDCITGYAEDRIQKLQLHEIYYFESVDNRVYAYTESQVYEVHKKLYEIEQDYADTDLIRISKSAVVNVSRITYIRPMLNGKFEATLKNNEKIMISRQYVPALKKKLEL